MSTATAARESHVILNNVSWRFYSDLLTEVGEAPGTRITYDGGTLQIMVVSAGHDNPNRTLADIVFIACEEVGVDFCPLGSTTFKREDLLKGVEPDSCFYFENAACIRDVDEIDLTIHPPPELAVEIDITNDSLNKLPVFAALGVREVWRYSRGVVTIYVLDGDDYRTSVSSSVLPALRATGLTAFLESSRRMKRLEWIRRVREYVRRP